TYEMSKKTNLVCFAMGENGLLSRILSPLFGASFTYASLERGLETAPGQITISELREIYRRLGAQS
ncbi:MAG: type I 3-dehydroquinate dehydratase, partial [Candidatus Bathyarchaeia archaeon]